MWAQFNRGRSVPFDNSAAVLAARQRPAIERMERAESWLEGYHRRGHQVLVEWLPSIHLVSMERRLYHPVGLLPELLWLLRNQVPPAKREEPPEAARYYGGDGWGGRTG